MTSSKQVNIRKNLIQSITNIPCDDFGQTTDLGVFSAYLYTPESCDGLQRHDHVMLPKGVLITVETPVSKRVSLNHPYRFNTITHPSHIYIPTCPLSRSLHQYSPTRFRGSSKQVWLDQCGELSRLPDTCRPEYAMH